MSPDEKRVHGDLLERVMFIPERILPVYEDNSAEWRFVSRYRGECIQELDIRRPEVVNGRQAIFIHYAG